MPFKFTKYSKVWETNFKWVKASEREKEPDQYAYCKVCKKDVRIAKGGQYDLTKHEISIKHKQNAIAGVGSHKMEQFFAKQDESLEVAAMEATQTTTIFIMP